MASYDVSPDLNKIVKQFAERKGCTSDEAVEYLLTKGIQKWNAEHKYIAKQAKADKAPKAKKAAKAKGPLARKAKAAPAKKARAPKAVATGGAEVAL